MNKIDKILNDDESISDYSKDVLRNHIDFIKETYPRMLERVNNIEKELEVRQGELFRDGRPC